MWSIEKGDLEISKKLLAAGVPVNAPDGNGETALTYAVRKQDAKLVQALLEKNADVKPRGKKGLSALMVACATGNLDIVKLLLDKDAPVNETSTEGATPLMLAAANGKADVARELIARKADVNLVAGEGEVTALTLAREKGHAEIVRMLKDAGAKELPPRATEKPIDYAKTTKSQWKERLRQLRYSPDSTPRRVPTEQQFKAIFGEPVRTQTVDLTAYWYFRCVDGTIQLKLVDPSQTRPQLVLDSVNDF